MSEPASPVAAPIRAKRGGKVKGKKPKRRLDKRARGGGLHTPTTVEDQEARKMGRADGGMIPTIERKRPGQKQKKPDTPEIDDTDDEDEPEGRRHGGRLRHRDDGGGLLGSIGEKLPPVFQEGRRMMTPISPVTKLYNEPLDYMQKPPDKGSSRKDSDMQRESAEGKRRGGGIHIKPSHKGLLHKDLGVPQGQKIPEAKIKAAEHSDNPKVRRRAQFADNAKDFHH